MRVSPALFRLFGHLPVPVSSGIGALLGPRHAPRQMPVRAERARRNLAVLRPDLDVEAREAILAARWRNMGRFLCELPVMAKLNRKGRTRVIDATGLAAVLETPRPIIFVSLHLGNWELLGAHLINRTGRAVLAVFQPPSDAAQGALLDAVRRQYIAATVAPGTGAARRIVRTLTDMPGAALYMLLDERRDFQVGFPFFGRSEAPSGNLSVALRIAARTNALILPLHLLRKGRCGFDLHWHAPIDIAEVGADCAARALNEYYEPLVLAHPEQWLALQDIALQTRPMAIADGSDARSIGVVSPALRSE